LHRHDHPSALSDREREQLIRDDHGGYFIGIAPREG
jgi:hypothetical protein